MTSTYQLSFIIGVCCLDLMISFRSKPLGRIWRTLETAGRVIPPPQFRMVSRINDYTNVTREDLIFNNIQRDIESELTRTLTTLLDTKFSSLETQIMNLDTRVSNLDTKLSTEINNLDTKFSTEIKSLENNILPLSNIYAILLVLGGSLVTFVVMNIAKIDWSSVVYKN